MLRIKILVLLILVVLSCTCSSHIHMCYTNSTNSFSIKLKYNFLGKFPPSLFIIDSLIIVNSGTKILHFDLTGNLIKEIKLRGLPSKVFVYDIVVQKYIDDKIEKYTYIINSGEQILYFNYNGEIYKKRIQLGIFLTQDNKSSLYTVSTDGLEYNQFSTKLVRYTEWDGFKIYKLGFEIGSASVFINKENEMIFYRNEDSSMYEYVKIDDEFLLKKKIKLNKHLADADILLKSGDKYYLHTFTENLDFDIITKVEYGGVIKMDTLFNSKKELVKSEQQIISEDYAHYQPTRTFFTTFNKEIFYLRNTKSGTTVTKYDK